MKEVSEQREWTEVQPEVVGLGLRGRSRWASAFDVGGRSRDGTGEVGGWVLTRESGPGRHGPARHGTARHSTATGGTRAEC